MRYRFAGLYLEGLIHGGAYFRNFTVCLKLLGSTGYRVIMTGGLFCGYLQSSQEKLETLMLIQNFGRQRRYIMGDMQVADLCKKLQRPKYMC